MAAMKGFGKAMRNTHTSSIPRLLVPLLVALGAFACTSEPATEVTGSCQPDPALDCSVAGLPAESANLAGYTCTGTARPDQGSTYIDGVPQGLVCADKPVGADGSRSYCCTNFTTQCSYNPTAICAQTGTFGYQCLGADRPEALNPAIGCDQGVREENLINYCCSGAGITANCTQSDSIGCVAGMTGWICPTGTQPTAEDLGANKSRADLYYLLCPVPTPAPNPKVETLCCFVPALVPAGGTCEQDMKAGCVPGRFGIACFGQDNPEDNFSRLHCPDPGTAGQTEQGYPATVYCCDFTRDD
jgi:hypothetical protein